MSRRNVGTCYKEEIKKKEKKTKKKIKTNDIEAFDRHGMHAAFEDVS